MSGMSKNRLTGQMTGRRAFLAGGASLLAAGGVFAGGKTPAFPAASPAHRKRPVGFKPLTLRPLRIEVGAAKPFKAIQISDTHLVRADARDRDPRKLDIAARRHPVMGFGEHYLAEAVLKANREGALLLHTGDVIDFVSEANLEIAGRYFASADCFVAAGNHEYSKYVGEAREDAAYKADSYDRVSAKFPNDLTFASRVVNGVNFVAVDDVYYNFTASQLVSMKNEVAKGLPIVLMCHVPLYAPRHYASVMKETNGVCSYETGVPDELIATWKAPARPFAAGEEWRDRRVQQKADAPTRAFVRYVKEQPLVKAVLCGHCHRFWQERLSPTARMYICAATYNGNGYAIDFV